MQNAVCQHSGAEFNALKILQPTPQALFLLHIRFCRCVSFSSLFIFFAFTVSSILNIWLVQLSRALVAYTTHSYAPTYSHTNNLPSTLLEYTSPSCTSRNPLSSQPWLASPQLSLQYHQRPPPQTLHPPHPAPHQPQQARPAASSLTPSKLVGQMAPSPSSPTTSRRTPATWSSFSSTPRYVYAHQPNSPLLTMPQNHSVVQSTFDNPCVPIQNIMTNKTHHD